MTGEGDDDLDPHDGSLEAMLFREFVRDEIGAAGARAMIKSAADAIGRGLRGVTVVDDLDRGTCSIDEAMFSFRRRGWGIHAIPISQAKAIIDQELDGGRTG